MNRDLRKVLFFDILAVISFFSLVSFLIIALIFKDFNTLPSFLSNLLIFGFFLYVAFWIIIQWVLYTSPHNKNWNLWFWSGPILLFGAVFSYLFYLMKYRPSLKNEKIIKFKFTPRIIILILLLVFSGFTIFVNSNGFTFTQEGVVIASVDSNSTAYEQGFRQGQIIKTIDDVKIDDLTSYSNEISGKFLSEQKQKIIFNTNEGDVIFYDNKNPCITVLDISKTNLKFGLDLSGGARALIKAEGQDLTADEVKDLVQITENRLNEFGLTDMKVAQVSDLNGNNYMLIEIAGATPNDLEEMIAKQGKFEAKIVNETVFVGGSKDISSICRGDSTCSGVRQCSQNTEGYVCQFQFAVYLSENSAERHADITKTLEVNTTSQGNYLSEKLDLYIDDNLVDSLLIGESLKGVATTQISISGSGTGTTRNEAIENAEDNMHKLQTILITGSLPYKLEIVKLDTISPAIGKEFLGSILLAGFVALLAVSILIFIRYKNIKLSLALLATSFSEVFIILGIASFISWNLDLPGIAGILATIGTGFDDLIVLLDESRDVGEVSLKRRLKRAFVIIMGAYITTFVSLLPLMWAGAGLLKGFAITTIIGISVGVLITRPAFSDMLKFMEN